MFAHHSLMDKFKRVLQKHPDYEICMSSRGFKVGRKNTDKRGWARFSWEQDPTRVAATINDKERERAQTRAGVRQNLQMAGSKRRSRSRKKSSRRRKSGRRKRRSRSRRNRS